MKATLLIHHYLASPPEISYISSSSRSRGEYGSRPKSLPGAPQPSGGTPGAPAAPAEQREWTDGSKDTRQRPHRSRSRTRGLMMMFAGFLFLSRVRKLQAFVSYGTVRHVLLVAAYSGCVLSQESFQLNLVMI